MGGEPVITAEAPNPAPGGSPEPTPAPVVAPAPVQADWRESIPAEYQAEKVWEPYAGKGLGDVLKSHVEQSKLLGRGITLPGKDAKPEDVAKWKQTQLPKLVEAGLVAAPPVTPDKYELKQPEIPHLPPFNDARLEHYKGGFHKLGLTQAQAQGLLELHAQDLDTLVKNADQLNLAAIQTLREQWGDAGFDEKWDQALTGVPHLAAEAEVSVQQLREYFDRTRKGNDPIMFKIMAAYGSKFQEDRSIGTGVTAPGPEGVQSEIERIRASEAYLNEKHPGNEAANKRLLDLYQLREMRAAR